MDLICRSVYLQRSQVAACLLEQIPSASVIPRDESCREFGKMELADYDLPPGKRPKQSRQALVPPPAFRPFQQATLAAHVPPGRGWLFEMEYDGFRCMAALSGPQVRLYAEAGEDWTGRFGSVVPALAGLTKGTMLIDGLVCAFDENGHSSLSELKRALAGEAPITFVAFDLLEQNGQDLTGLPLAERKQRLEEIIGDQDERSPLHYSQHIEGDGASVFRVMCNGGFEGVLAKRSASTYRPGKRSPDWLKIKCAQRQEFVVLGWRSPETRETVRSLFLGSYEDGKLVYRGQVGVGLSDKDRGDLLAILKPIQTGERRRPVTGVPRAEARIAHWVEPRLVAEVTYTDVAPDGQLRHPSFRGIRQDKDPLDSMLRPDG
ncbi:MAG TPA: non-homologous end-joining DNA ligase [Devosiaceae bacterium]|nr:non-homologous end-joining DNA ligase [Devosiaceae bacterium]